MSAIPIALQLYTVRKYCEENLESALRQVADMGYIGVELAGTYGRTPEEFGKLLDEYGFERAGAHVGLDPDDMDAVKSTLQQNKIMGVDTVGIGIGGQYFEDAAGVDQGVELLTRLGRACRDQGVELVYHNHGKEFKLINGEHAMNLLYDRVPKELLKAELDVYWVLDGGGNPTATVARHRDRATLLHIKDGIRSQKPPHVAVGHGELDMPSIINAADPNVTRYLIVELDDTDGDMMEAVRRSYDYLVGAKLARGRK